MSDIRYVVRYSIVDEERFLVFVVDKFIGRIVFKANTRDKKKEYEYIKKYYGQENCSPPPKEPVKVENYE